jgi:UDP-N-acetylmuramyl pentapeptide phosphotransferase/UDP-N-acetylglucosamine-1-phosphate transferase
MWVVFLVVLLISFLLTLVYRKYAIHKSVMDIPNDRSSHTIPTPRGGGIAVAISWFVGLVYFYIEGKIEPSFFYALLCGLPLAIIGFADDLFNLKPGIRFLVQFLCAGSGLWFLGGLCNCQILNINCQLTFLLTPLAFITIIWFINLFNFLDGIDGYIGTEIVFIGISTFVLAGDKLGILLAISVSGFLIWNWPKAKIFMGDVGSTLLGYIIAIFVIYYQNKLQISIVVWLILTSVFWFDATVTLIRRYLNKENLSIAHRKHAFQRIVQAGFSHQKTVLYCLLLNLFGLGLVFLCKKYNEFSFLFLLLDILVLAIIYWLIEIKKPFNGTI